MDGTKITRQRDGRMESFMFSTKITRHSPRGGTLNVEVIGMLVGNFFGKP